MRQPTFHFIIGSLICIATIAAGCDSITRVDSTKLRTVAVASLKSSPEQWREVEVDLSAGRECVFVVRKGESIPLDAHVALPMARLQSEKTNLVFTSDTYFLVSQGSMRISPDGQRWADIDDIRAQRELFGFKSGQVGFGFSASETAGAKFSLDIQTK